MAVGSVDRKAVLEGDSGAKAVHEAHKSASTTRVKLLTADFMVLIFGVESECKSGRLSDLCERCQSISTTTGSATCRQSIPVRLLEDLFVYNGTNPDKY